MATVSLRPCCNWCKRGADFRYLKALHNTIVAKILKTYMVSL